MNWGLGVWQQPGYLGHGLVITSHGTQWDVITYSCPRYPGLLHQSSSIVYILCCEWHIVNSFPDVFIIILAVAYQNRAWRRSKFFHVETSHFDIQLQYFNSRTLCKIIGFQLSLMTNRIVFHNFCFAPNFLFDINSFFSLKWDDDLDKFVTIKASAHKPFQWDISKQMCTNRDLTYQSPSIWYKFFGWEICSLFVLIVDH